MNIEEIINPQKKTTEIIEALREKSIILPHWSKLEKEYEPTKHPIMNKALYPDIIEEDGSLTEVTRVTYALQKLAVKRLRELCYGIPVKRVYNNAEDSDELKAAADAMDAIFRKARVDAKNNESATGLFASCETMRVWYAEEKPITYGKWQSKLRLRCANFSPMRGDELYPLFDEYGDLIAISVQYKRRVKGKDVTYFETWTAEKHYRWSNEEQSEMTLVLEQQTIGKIPVIYMWRPQPAWEDTSGIVYEMEWAMSRNGNYLRDNSRPLFTVFADEEIPFGNEPKANDGHGKGILKYPKGSNAQYVTWQQAVDSLKFHITELRQIFFTQLQLPDWSFDNMKAVPQSGESMKQMFIDAVLKVADEKAVLEEFHDREVSVIKEFMKSIEPSMSDVIDDLDVETVITPCMLDTQAEASAEEGGMVVDGTRVQTDEANGPRVIQSTN